ncbi:MAG: aminopeptidase P family protein, partial [Candidatus Omnitrophica bacterium]|nr:aminopeptidase P family protein [Candidatus Omnitrophota bacterium]
MKCFDFKRRLALLKDGIMARGLDALLVTGGSNVSYLSGFTGHDSMLLITRRENHFITDSRYIEEAKNTVADFDIGLMKRSAYEAISGIAKKSRLKRIGFEAMDLSYGVAAKLTRLAGAAKFVPCIDMVEALRSIKDPDEIAMIKESVRLNRKIFGLIAGKVRPGVSERSIARKIESMYLEAGARAAFDPIIAAGKNASKPHAVPGDTRIGKNSFVMVDMGARLGNYCSDLTRMVEVGRVKNRYRKVLSIVMAAREKAIAAVRPGAKLSDIDAAGRGHIEREGFGKYFGHSLGHGVGIDVHEKPTISAMSEGITAAGMVFTV